MKKSIFAMALILLASGCANRIYEWDNYDARLYKYYKEPTTAEEFRVSLQDHFKTLESRNLRPGPGMYAELGTLYLEGGDRTTAAVYYTKERDAWPESRPMMDAMIVNLQKPLKSKEEK
jgi:hypothetical protein